MDENETKTAQANDTETVERFAQKIIAAKLEAPALLLLELHRPLFGIFYHASLFFEPLVRPFCGASRYMSLKALLSNPQNIEALCSILESHSQNNSAQQPKN